MNQISLISVENCSITNSDVEIITKSTQQLFLEEKLLDFKSCGFNQTIIGINFEWCN